MIELIETQDNGRVVYRMENDRLRVMLTNLGCQLLSIEMKDEDGSYHDVILRPKDPEHPEKDSSYMGAVVGRIANRITI